MARHQHQRLQRRTESGEAISSGVNAAATVSTSSGASPVLANAGRTTNCSNQRPPTQNVWASSQLIAPARNGARLDMANLDDLVLDVAARGSHQHGIASVLPISARAIGEFTEILPPLISASSSPTIW